MVNQTTPERHDFSTHREKTRHDYYHGIKGARLRHAALAVLMAVGSCSIDEMWTCLKGRHRLDPSVSKKSVADALRYECGKGRARRIEGEEREIGPELTRGELEAHLLGEEERRLLELLTAQKRETAPLPDAVDIAQADERNPSQLAL